MAYLDFVNFGLFQVYQREITLDFNFYLLSENHFKFKYNILLSDKIICKQ
jgi:hypothetical protein